MNIIKNALLATTVLAAMSAPVPIQSQVVTGPKSGTWRVIANGKPAHTRSAGHRQDALRARLSAGRAAR